MFLIIRKLETPDILDSVLQNKVKMLCHDFEHIYILYEEMTVLHSVFSKLYYYVGARHTLSFYLMKKKAPHTNIRYIRSDDTSNKATVVSIILSIIGY